MDKSIFADKKQKPDNAQLKQVLGKTSGLWNEIHEYVHTAFPAALDEWNFPSEKYGWSFRMKDGKRVLVYLLPRDSFFKVAMVFGQKATDAVMQSNISENIKTELMMAKPYAEGRGIRIDILKKAILKDIQQLIDIKLAY